MIYQNIAEQWIKDDARRRMIWNTAFILLLVAMDRLYLILLHMDHRSHKGLNNRAENPHVPSRLKRNALQIHIHRLTAMAE